MLDRKKTFSLIFIFIFVVIMIGAIIALSITTTKNSKNNELNFQIPEEYIDKINPYPFYSKEAQNIKYPPGIDTVAYWGNGRYNICLDIFYDEENWPHKDIFSGIKILRLEKNEVYMKGANGYLLFIPSTHEVKIFKNLESIPHELNDSFKKMNQIDDVHNIVFDAKTLRPIKHGSLCSLPVKSDSYSVKK